MHTTSTSTRRRAPTVPTQRRESAADSLTAVRASGGINRPPALIDRQSVVAHQRTLGNAAVCRMLQRQRASQATAPPIQRYPVDVPRNADCDRLLDWLNTENPYAGDGNWAETTCNYNVEKGAPSVSPYEVDGVTFFRVRLNNPRVSVTCSVDMPRWRPLDRAMQRAWRAAWDRLREHEAEHEEIGQTHRRIMQGFLGALDIYTDETNRADAIAVADKSIDEDLERLEADQQGAQKAIDPYRAPLDCPDEETEEATEASAGGRLGDVIGGLAGWFGGETSNQAKPVATNAEKPSDGGGWISDLFPAGGDKDEEDAGSWWS